MRRYGGSMLRRLDAALFDDRSPNLDRFGVLFVLTVIGIALLALVDQRSERGLWTVASVMILTCFIGAMFMLAMRASGVRRGWRIAADVVVVIGVALTVGFFVLGLLTEVDLSDYPAPYRPSPEAWLWTLIATVLPVLIVRRLLHHRHVTLSTLLGAISAYLLIAVAFEFLFITLDAYQDPPFFGRVEPTTSFMYFSLTTITTLGYGDLAPATPLGQLLAVSEAVIGQVFLVTFVAMVVGLMGQRLGAAGMAPAEAMARSVGGPDVEMPDRPDGSPPADPTGRP
ncbi:MAG: ion channel [Chloroflexota bacterium]|nr:ion channel [Chloroflexota bacterium]